MEDNTSKIAEIRSLAETVCTGSITPERCERLNTLLLDEQAALTYAVYLRMHGLLCWHWQDQIVVIETPETPPLVQLPADTFPTGLLGGAWQGTVGFFSQTMPFSYLTATVILGVMLFSAWVYKINLSYQIVDKQSIHSNERQSLVFVGRITGMKDCKWSGQSTEPLSGAYVPLGRKYALSSGLMQITYDSGAKVILEGPCTYEVESGSGGYLSLGRLTAKVESAKPQAANQKSSPLFSVRTPTAIVTDLGTEFGVEVSEEGNTTSYVFRGSVKVQVVGKSLPSPVGRGAGGEGCIVLHANESARVEKDKNTGDSRLVIGSEVGVPPKFVRRMGEPPKLLDLLDIVAGGRGTGNRRERGIDPATGKQDTWLLSTTRKDDHDYHRVAWHPLIDGVFIPHIPTSLPPAPQSVQLDSAGNTFDRFLEVRLAKDNQYYARTIRGYTVGSIWSRAADIKSVGAINDDSWMYSLINDAQHMPEGRGLLGLHANVGITFDLAAMRKMYEGVRPSRLRTTVSMGDGPRKYPDAFGIADLWIFVDGRLKWVRKDIRHKDGAIKVDVPLDLRDRFLTIVSTNGSSGKAYDWIVLGDPVLKMKPTQSEEH